MSALLIVKAQVTQSDWNAFDSWYEREHLIDARKAFNATSAWRGWSDDSPLTHYAFYEFDDLHSARAAGSSDAIKRLIEEFDSRWQGRVTRTREIVESVQRLG